MSELGRFVLADGSPLSTEELSKELMGITLRTTDSAMEMLRDNGVFEIIASKNAKGVLVVIMAYQISVLVVITHMYTKYPLQHRNALISTLVNESKNLKNSSGGPLLTEKDISLFLNCIPIFCDQIDSHIINTGTDKLTHGVGDFVFVTIKNMYGITDSQVPFATNARVVMKLNTYVGIVAEIFDNLSGIVWLETSR